MADRFNDFMKPLKETHFSLKDYVDFPEVAANVETKSARNKLEEAFAHIPSVYNLTNINTLIDKLKW